MADLTRFQAGNLFLLVGTNPLPNYVAASLLASGGGTIYLLHSGGPRGTGKVAIRLKQAIEKKLPHVQSVFPYEIDEADGNRIVQKVSEIIDNLPSDASVGLHYTGGTKPMAVHAYRAIEQRFPEGVFSYLDARSLSMVWEQKEQPNPPIPIGLEVKPDIQTLLGLHGYTLKHDPIQKATRPEICRSLANIGAQWREWCDQNLRSGSNTPFRRERELKTVTLPCLGEIDWQGCHTLTDLAIQWETKVGKLAKWLDGKWLEHYTLWALQQIASQYHIHQTGMNIEPKERHFEFDVIAMRGYQLFALSCSTETQKGVLKLKLFEAYIRARQMGGDEARVGLVCCYRDPDALRQEIEEAWYTEGRVQVFGVKDLPKLPEHLATWFETAGTH